MPDAPMQKGLAPFSLRDAPALIESVFPAQKVGIEAQSERSAGPGQTLTPVGSYWKGRKPLILTRACVLASLIPPSGDPAEDLKLLESLLGMDDTGIQRRRPAVTAAHIVAKLPRALWAEHIEQLGTAEDEGGDVPKPKWKWRRANLAKIADPHLRRIERERIEAERASLKSQTFAALTFAEKVGVYERVEKVETIDDPHDPFYFGVWQRVNARFGTTARTIPQLIEQLGIARFGHQPIVGDPSGDVPVDVEIGGQALPTLSL